MVGREFFEDNDPREIELRRLATPAPELSAWQRYCPTDAWRDPVLRAIEAYLDEPATRVLYDQHEESEAYPREVLDHLGELGLAEILSPKDGARRLTAYHMCALNAVAARRDTSVAVTLSVNVLGLLPAYLAASPEQIERISEKVDRGHFASLLLSELSHGSNLLRNQARAERGTLDGNGNFVAAGDEEPCTHYRLVGEKHLINGATEHGILFVCMRTRGFDAYDVESEIKEPMKARADFTLFWLDRGPGMEPLPRWHTLPARAADISGLRFNNCIVEADRVIGREHGGLMVAHKTLMLSRGGVAALASGCVSRARDLAFHYAYRRNINGCPIVHLGAISDHLMQLHALDLLAASISLKATALLNAVGLAAAHYTVVAKIMACSFAQEGVAHGQKVLGARALLRELPFERLIRDVSLFGVFDGTSHVMLEELSGRLAQEAQPDLRGNRESTLDTLRPLYQSPPQTLTETLRAFRRPIVLPLVRHLEALDALQGRLDLEPLVIAARSLFAFVRLLNEAGQWKTDQGTRLATAELFATLEVLSACVELCDPERRLELGLADPIAFDKAADRSAYDFAITWLGSRVIASIRQLLLKASLGEERDEPLRHLEQAERRILDRHDETRRRCHEAQLRNGAGVAAGPTTADPADREPF